jgi:hypothetical protein
MILVYNLIGGIMKNMFLQCGDQLNQECLSSRIGIIVLPLYDDGDILLVAKNSLLLDEWVIELPYGENLYGETPLESANRVFIQETGMYATNIEENGIIYPSVGSYELVYFFVATQVQEFNHEYFQKMEKANIKISPSKLANLISDKVFIQDIGIKAFKKFYFAQF